MTKGMPREAATAIRMALEGEGSRLRPSGMSIVAVAVLLIKAARRALERQSTRRRTDGKNPALGMEAGDWEGFIRNHPVHLSAEVRDPV